MKKVISEVACQVVIIAIALLSVGDVAAKSKELKFTGKQLWEKSTGLTVLPDPDKADLTITSIHHGFFLILPYSESWVFQTSREMPLQANDDHYVVSIVHEPRRPEETERERLAEMLSKLEASGKVSVSGNEFLDSYGHVVLRYEARLISSLPAAQTTSSANYWTVRQQGSAWVTLHLSSTNGTTNDATLLKMMGAGFAGDFEVK